MLLVAILAGCSTLPPGADYPKVASTAFGHPDETRLGNHFSSSMRQHAGNSGFRMISAGADGFLMRLQMIDAAQRSLDLQYFIFRADDTGRLLTDAIVRAAARGVRVRLLIDDADTVDGDDHILRLGTHSSIQVRVFNPFAYRGHVPFFRGLEFLFNASRLDYRMHNKLLIVDNAVGLVGGRNIGDEYFQINPDGQFADDDVFAVGPIVPQLSATFDDYWNSKLSIPVQAFFPTGMAKNDAPLNASLPEISSSAGKTEIAAVNRDATGNTLEGIVSGQLPLIWAHAQLVCDSPDKKDVENGTMVGKLMQRPVLKAVLGVQSELLMITPYTIPGEEGMQMFSDLRSRGVRVRLLTDSLEASTESAAQAGYMHYRVPLLQDGVELYEIRALLGDTKGSGQTAHISRYGNYSLHAKLFVLDRQRLFIGSMNFDQRSLHLNTEIGLIIDSPELAQQAARRFEAMTRPENAYQVILRDDSTGASHLAWRSEENGHAVEYDSEPAKNAWQRAKVDMLSILPLDSEL